MRTQRGETRSAARATSGRMLSVVSVGSALMRYMVAANAISIITFAPIPNAWLGTLSPRSKIPVASALCFFPVLVNTLRGPTSVRPESLEVMDSYADNQRAVFRRLRIPNSLLFLFTVSRLRPCSR